MARELPKIYDPSEVESSIYEMWEGNGYFHAKRDENKKPYTIVMPPPTSPASCTLDQPWPTPCRTC